MYSQTVRIFTQNNTDSDSHRQSPFQ